MAKYSTVSIYICTMGYTFFIHSFMERQLIYFHTLAIQISVFIFFLQGPGSGISGSYDNSIFYFFEELHVVFHGGFTNYKPWWFSNQKCMSVSFSPHSCQHWLFLNFLILAIWQVQGDISLWFNFHFPEG